MTQVIVLDHQGRAVRDPVQGVAAEDLLWAVGVESGGWAPHPNAVSSVPQLAYARELLALQKRFGHVMTQRRRLPAGRTGDEPPQLHMHDELEIRVVVQGVLRMSVSALTLGGWLQVEVGACEWVAVPAQVPHSAAADLARGVDLLCLYTQPGGWRARLIGEAPALGLPPGHQPLPRSGCKPGGRPCGQRRPREPAALAA
jgi:mannose-6-phosphate isomerase-like protein (cupin superfamily)